MDFHPVEWRRFRASLVANSLELAAVVIGKSSLLPRLRPFLHVELAVDEYSMSWSDAIRAETDFAEGQALVRPCDDVEPFGTLGRALWRERSLAWILRLDASVRADDAQKIVAALRAAFRPVHRDAPYVEPESN